MRPSAPRRQIARRWALADRALALDHQAEKLQARFDASFWDADLGTYVLALDGDKRPCRIRTSNAGHALFTGIAPLARAPQIVQSLISSASFSGWGIRTVAAGEARYNPMSYHNGSVWPHDNALIALGFARYGYGAEVTKILKGLFEASVYIDLRRLPELFCGFARVRRQGPTFYPVACSPQAWAATAPLALLGGLPRLELRPAKPLRDLRPPALARIPPRGDAARPLDRRCTHGRAIAAHGNRRRRECAGACRGDLVDNHQLGHRAEKYEAVFGQI